MSNADSYPAKLLREELYPTQGTQRGPKLDEILYAAPFLGEETRHGFSAAGGFSLAVWFLLTW